MTYYAGYDLVGEPSAVYGFSGVFLEQKIKHYGFPFVYNLLLKRQKQKVIYHVNSI